MDDPVVDATAPADVTGLAAIEGIGQVVLSWTAPADSDFDHVEISSNPVMATYKVAAGTTTLTVTGLTNGTSYEFTVVSVDASGNKSSGATVSATPTATPVDATAPADVTGLTATPGDGQATLDWTEPADVDFDHVEITSSPTTSTYTIPAGTTTLTATGLSNGVSYAFTVVSVDASGNKSSGTTASATPVDATAPADVTGLTATPGNHQVTLSWTKPSDADFYRVEIFVSQKNNTYHFGSSISTCTIEALVNGTTYDFTVKAEDLSGNLSAGVTVSAVPVDVVPPAEVANLEATAGDRQATLSWTEPSDVDFDHVEISSSPATTTYTVASGTTTRTITGLTTGTSYTITVASVDMAGNASTGATVDVVPIGPCALTYDANGATGGTAPTDATVYEYGDTVTAASNDGDLVFLPSGAECRKFGGWNTMADGSGDTYEAGSGTFAIGHDTTLYAYWVAFSVTDIGPAGGYVFYDKGSFSEGWRYLESAPSSSDADARYVWGGYGTDVDGAEGTAVGTGKQNTADIVTEFGDTEPYGGLATYAAKICNDLEVANGDATYTDWFLPSRDEFDLMYDNLHEAAAGELGGWPSGSNVVYWTSSERSSSPDSYAWYQYSSDGYQQYKSKITTYRVRACRQF